MLGKISLAFEISIFLICKMSSLSWTILVYQHSPYPGFIRCWSANIDLIFEDMSMKIKKIHSFRWIMWAIIATQQLRHLSNWQFFMTLWIFSYENIVTKFYFICKTINTFWILLLIHRKLKGGWSSVSSSSFYKMI